MFAMLVSTENMPRITEEALTNEDRTMIDVYLRNREEWYVVRGYVDRFGRLWTELVLLPAYILRDNYEIDFEHAKTDWDQIVRK